MPSHGSAKGTKAKIEQDTRDKPFAITIGDRVTVEDCPGHWSWASPFTIQSIEGEMAKLEMVGKLVEIDRLSSIN